MDTNKASKIVGVLFLTAMVGSLVGGVVSYPHYIFIAIVEVICLLLIIWNAWKWTEQEA